MVIRVGSSPILHTKKAFFCNLQKNAFFSFRLCFYIILPRLVRKAADSAAMRNALFLCALPHCGARFRENAVEKRLSDKNHKKSI